jgi:hypothetical protein
MQRRLDDPATHAAAVRALHERAIIELYVAARQFERLGERNMCALYEARARDLALQGRRHLVALGRAIT